MFWGASSRVSWNSTVRTQLRGMEYWAQKVLASPSEVSISVSVSGLRIRLTFSSASSAEAVSANRPKHKQAASRTVRQRFTIFNMTIDPFDHIFPGYYTMISGGIQSFFA